jgi:hypothetical protein
MGYDRGQDCPSARSVPLSPTVRGTVGHVETRYAGAEARQCCTGGQGSEPTVRRVTEGSGAADVDGHTAAVATIEQTLPPAPVGFPGQTPAQWGRLDSSSEQMVW